MSITLKMLRNQSFVTPFLFRFHFVCCYTKLKKSFAHFCAKANLTVLAGNYSCIFFDRRHTVNIAFPPNFYTQWQQNIVQCDKEIVFIVRQGRRYINSTVADKFHCVPAYNNYTGYAFSYGFGYLPD